MANVTLSTKIKAKKKENWEEKGRIRRSLSKRKKRSKKNPESLLKNRFSAEHEK